MLDVIQVQHDVAAHLERKVDLFDLGPSSSIRCIGWVQAGCVVAECRAVDFHDEEAESIGLVNQVVPGEKLLDAAREMAASMTDKHPAVLAAARAVLNYGETHDMEESMRNEERTSAALRKAKAAT